ncbi:MAG: mandelate racemase/muconate lactonizing enzyme family protein [Candidatus Bathyarchaeia archaeon]
MRFLSRQTLELEGTVTRASSKSVEEYYVKIVDMKATPILLKAETVKLPTGQLYPAGGTCLVEIKTDAGLTGIGESDAGGPWGEAFIAVKAFIEKAFKPLILGEDPTNYRSLWDKIHDYSWYVDTGIGMSALSGVDMALLDLAGKSEGVPACKVLGGCYRNRVRPYASHPFITPASYEEGIKDAVTQIEKGFTAVKMSFTKFPNFGENLNEDIKYVKKVRDAIGYDIDLMISDFAPPRPVSKAISMARRLEEFDLIFWEECLPRGDVEAYCQLSAAVDLPIEAGEEMTNQMLRYFIFRRAVDVINPDVTHIGGLSEAKKLADLATAMGIKTYPHQFSSAVSMAANVHLVASMPDGDLCEYRTSYPDASMDELLLKPLKFDKGYIEVPNAPGLGIELNKEVVEKIMWKC